MHDGTLGFWSVAARRGRRWSDNDRHFGPFTLSLGDYNNVSAVLDSGGGGERGAHCHLRLRAFRCTLIVELPAVIKPWRQWIDTSRHEWSGPGGGYWDQHSREYGFNYSPSDGFLQVFLGAQTHDSTTTQSWCKFLPWTQWRHIRRSMFDDNGEHFWTEWSRPRGFALRDSWLLSHEVQKVCPAVTFAFDDYDGQRIHATTRIEEREWRFGEGWFRWLSLFRRPRVRRSLDIDFSAEVGPEKGSWKGGTTGHGIEMLPGEMHEEAFRRYCEQEHRSKYRPFRLTFVERIKPAPANDSGEAACKAAK